LQHDCWPAEQRLRKPIVVRAALGSRPNVGHAARHLQHGLPCCLPADYCAARHSPLAGGYAALSDATTGLVAGAAERCLVGATSCRTVRRSKQRPYIMLGVGALRAVLSTNWHQEFWKLL